MSSHPPALTTDAATAPTSSLPLDLAAQGGPHLTLLAQRQPIVLFTLDALGRFVYLDGHGCFQMGVDPLRDLQSPIETVFASAPDLVLRLKQALGSAKPTRWNGEVGGHVWEFSCTAASETTTGVDAVSHLPELHGVALNITQRRHVEAELRWERYALTALNHIAAAVTNTHSLPHLLETLKRQLESRLHILGGVVFLQKALTPSEKQSTPPPPPSVLPCYFSWGISPPLAERTNGEIQSAGRRGFLHKAGRAAYHLDGLFDVETEGEEPLWQAALCVPLIADGQISGRLVLYSQDAFGFKKHSTTIFELMGGQVGAALQNAQRFQEVVEAKQELQNLAHRVVSIQEAERTHIARELHDEFGQILTCLKLSLEMAERPSTTVSDAHARRNQAKMLAEDMLARVRSMVLELRAPDLDDLGLVPALRNYTEGFADQTGMDIAFQSGIAEDTRFGEPVETAAYRIVQEALTNAARYAGSDLAHVSLNEAWDPDAGKTLHVCVQDFGQGFDTNQKTPKSSGLTGMRERAAALGGTFLVTSGVGGGTCVEAWLPIHAANIPTGNSCC